MWKSAKLRLRRRSNCQTFHTCNVSGNYIHHHATWINRSPSRNVEAHTIYRNPFLSHCRSINNCCCFGASSLLFMDKSNSLYRTFERLSNLRIQICKRRINILLQYLDAGRPHTVEFFCQIEQIFLRSILYPFNYWFNLHHRACNIHVCPRKFTAILRFCKCPSAKINGANHCHLSISVAGSGVQSLEASQVSKGWNFLLSSNSCPTRDNPPPRWI
ncbi:unannotated protein [freshwater metagenome]|uniref:Unannotated protein n=1 Tax=freshwater metagenome TaxID=449393 RepID=A0A6J6G480_9ZZZZ